MFYDLWLTSNSQWANIFRIVGDRVGLSRMRQGQVHSGKTFYTLIYIHALFLYLYLLCNLICTLHTNNGKIKGKTKIKNS